MSYVLRVALVVVLLGLLVVILVAGWHVWNRLETGESLVRRLAWLPVALLLLLSGFAIIVELRCALGWIAHSECHVWDHG
jgi:hypothetical protein